MPAKEQVKDGFIRGLGAALAFVVVSVAIGIAARVAGVRLPGPGGK